MAGSRKNRKGYFVRLILTGLGRMLTWSHVKKSSAWSMTCACLPIQAEPKNKCTDEVCRSLQQGSRQQSKSADMFLCCRLSSAACLHLQTFWKSPSQNDSVCIGTDGLPQAITRSNAGFTHFSNDFLLFFAGCLQLATSKNPPDRSGATPQTFANWVIVGGNQKKRITFLFHFSHQQ